MGNYYIEGKQAYDQNKPLSSCYYRGQAKYEWEAGWFNREKELLVKEKIKNGSPQQNLT